MENSGFEKVSVSPRQVYVDDSNPDWVEGFTRNMLTTMIQGIAEEAIEQQLIDRDSMERGIEDICRTSNGGGTYCYTFFKGKGTKIAKPHD